MNKSTQPKPFFNTKRVMWISLVLAIIWLALYAWVYQFEPLSKIISPYWNDKTLDILTLLPAISAAFMGLQVTRQFEPGEPPRRIWLSFTIGWFCWVAGEIAGFVYDYYFFNTSYPDLTLIDLCWILGYFFFGLSLFYQFMLIYGPQKKANRSMFFMLLGLALLIALGLTQLARHIGLGADISWFALFIAVLYPVFDVSEGLAALWLSFLFGRGRLGRPWWGLLAFAFADSINIFFWMGGDRQLSKLTVAYLDLFSNTVYVGGYLIVTLALLFYYLTVHYGPANKNTGQPGKLTAR
jgi:hypothetical protein